MRICFGSALIVYSKSAQDYGSAEVSSAGYWVLLKKHHRAWCRLASLDSITARSGRALLSPARPGHRRLRTSMNRGTSARRQGRRAKHRSCHVCRRRMQQGGTTSWPPIFQSDLPGPPPHFDDVLPTALTMIFPAMYGWMVQIYGYSPGAAKVWEKVSSVSSAADLKVPFLSPIRCGLSSSFFQVTVVPAVIVSVAGVKAKLSILTAAGLAAAALTASPAAGSSGKTTASSEVTPTAPSNRAIRRCCAGLIVVSMALPLRRQACCRSARERSCCGHS